MTMDQRIKDLTAAVSARFKSLETATQPTQWVQATNVPLGAGGSAFNQPVVAGLYLVHIRFSAAVDGNATTPPSVFPAAVGGSYTIPNWTQVSRITDANRQSGNFYLEFLLQFPGSRNLYVNHQPAFISVAGVNTAVNTTILHLSMDYRRVSS